MISRLHNKIGTFRQLEILLAVYERDGISAASEHLHLTQPTVSMQLKKLSEAVEMPLYQRAGRKLVFTEAGTALVAAAREIMQSFERADTYLADLRGLKAGTLRIAVVTTSKYFIPHLLGSFCEIYPQVDIQFRVGNRQQILERLEQGLDDLYVFSHLPEQGEFQASDFLPNPLVAIAPEGHSLADRKSLTLRDLSRLPFLMREPGSGTRYAIEKHFREKGVPLSVKMTIESNEAIKHAVMSDLGISILSAHTLAFGGRAGLTELRVRGLPIRSRWFLVRPGNMTPSLIAQAFLDHLDRSEQLNELIEELSPENSS
jgi:DNA-binding transcriptional LysR family regulator